MLWQGLIRGNVSIIGSIHTMVKSEPDLNIISIDAIKDAAERISDFVVRTPLLESSTLNE